MNGNKIHNGRHENKGRQNKLNPASRKKKISNR